MATGDSNDILSHLKSLVPGGWFSFLAPVRDAVMGGLADNQAADYNLQQAVKATTRINGTTGWLLDLVVRDFLNYDFPRRAGETDNSYRTRFIRELFRERVTRAGISEALTILTQRAPSLYEAFNPGDTGGYGSGRIGYGVAGRYGSIRYPNQIFITAYRPKTGGIPYIAGYGASTGGYGVRGRGNRAAYASLSQIVTAVSDADIYAAVAATKAAGVIAWVHITN